MKAIGCQLIESNNAFKVYVWFQQLANLPVSLYRGPLHVVPDHFLPLPLRHPPLGEGGASSTLNLKAPRFQKFNLNEEKLAFNLNLVFLSLRHYISVTKFLSFDISLIMPSMQCLGKAVQVDSPIRLTLG